MLVQYMAISGMGSLTDGALQLVCQIGRGILSGYLFVLPLLWHF